MTGVVLYHIEGIVVRVPLIYDDKLVQALNMV